MRLLSAAAILCLAVGCGGGGVEGGDSPEDAFNRLKNGLENANYDTVMRCTAPEARDGMLFGMMMVLGFTAMDNEDAKTEVEDILNKHGVSTDEDKDVIDLDDEEAMNKAIAKTFKDVTNKPALFQELMEAAAKYDDQTESFPLSKEAKLKDVKIEGDKATGTISSEKGDRGAEFVKKDGRWYCKFD